MRVVKAYKVSIQKTPVMTGQLGDIFHFDVAAESMKDAVRVSNEIISPEYSGSEIIVIELYN